jgi:hypothetical protein
MTKGKSHGINRDYQVLARDIVKRISQEGNLVPYECDGIDVAVEIGGANWTFDVALKTTDGSNIVVGECKRWNSALQRKKAAQRSTKGNTCRD